MSMLTVRNLPDDVHHALKAQAALRGLSMEAQVREILALAVKPASRVRMGQALGKLGRQIGLTNKDVALIDAQRNKNPANPMLLS